MLRGIKRAVLRAAFHGGYRPQVTHALEIVHHRVASKSTASVRILHLSDLHCRHNDHTPDEVAAVIAALRFDVVVHTGDFINVDSDLPVLTKVLSLLRTDAPAFAVLGNHDHLTPWSDRIPNDSRAVREALASAGVTVLDNTCAPIPGTNAWIAGVDDPVTQRSDVAAATANLPREAGTVILAAHSPDVVLELGSFQPGVVLAGHTHGGQVRLPLIGPVLHMSSLPRRFNCGLAFYGDVPVVVSRGIGHSGMAWRIGCPSQAGLVSLGPS